MMRNNDVKQGTKQITQTEHLLEQFRLASVLLLYAINLFLQLCGVKFDTEVPCLQCFYQYFLESHQAPVTLEQGHVFCLMSSKAKGKQKEHSVGNISWQFFLFLRNSFLRQNRHIINHLHYTTQFDDLICQHTCETRTIIKITNTLILFKNFFCVLCSPALIHKQHLICFWSVYISRHCLEFYTSGITHYVLFFYLASSMQHIQFEVDPCCL